MKITLVEIQKLKPYRLNAKKHPESQIEGIAESIRRFGFTQPVVIDGQNNVIIGHGRIEAAKKAGLTQVPCLTRDDLTENEVRALRLLDNRIAETSWDPDWEIAHIKSETGHGTQKPVECMRRPIVNNTSRGQAVYDPFLGSGTTLIAAEETGRQCLGMEIDPRYCDVIVQRWENFTGGKAILEGRSLRDGDQGILPELATQVTG